MPMSERYYTVEGQMVGCDKAGVRTDFLTDHLGSIIAEVDQDENVTYQARYSAFGQATSSTGTGCGFGWVGSYGYRETGLPRMSHYVRARHYSFLTGNWSTVDPLWPDESAYGYVRGAGTSRVDYSGLNAIPPGLARCLGRKPKAACFECAYKYFRTEQLYGPPIVTRGGKILPGGSRHYNPEKACAAANAICGSHLTCNPCGPGGGGATSPPNSCDPRNIRNYANWLRHECGGFGGWDKLAHCWGHCMVTYCGSGIGKCWSSSEPDDDPLDELANGLGRKIGSDLHTNLQGPAQECFDRCRKAVGNLEQHD